MNKTVLAIVGLSIAMIAGFDIVSTVQAAENFMPYGSVGQEDEELVYSNGFYYLNVVPSEGNGMFMKLTDIDSDYSIDQAIERFGINEDVRTFEVQPSVYSETALVYQLNDDLQFEMIGVVQ